MTDEEMAEEYATKECCTTCANDFCKGKCECWTFAKNGFLAGLKVGKDMNVSTKWHKVADGDYPKDNMPYIVKVKLNYKGASNISYWLKDNLHDDFEKHKNYTEDIIAWCEIPKYTEE